MQWAGVFHIQVGKYMVEHMGHMFVIVYSEAHLCAVLGHTSVLKAVYHSWPQGHTCHLSLLYDRFNTKD